MCLWLNGLQPKAKSCANCFHPLDCMSKFASACSEFSLPCDPGQQQSKQNVQYSCQNWRNPLLCEFPLHRHKYEVIVIGESKYYKEN